MIYAIIILIISNLAFLVLAILYYRKFKSLKRKDSVELREFLAELMTGDAILRITVIDPGNILLRSPRRS